LSAKITSFFNWSGRSAKVFNAGQYRRETLGAEASGRSDFFSANDSTAVSQREHIAKATLDRALDFLDAGGSVAIFDATNSTRERRAMVRECVGNRAYLVFLESLCTDPEVLRTNLLQKVKHSPDFKGLEEEAALSDLRARIAKYEAVYEPLEDSEGLPYIKIIDLASKVVSYQLRGPIPLEVCRLLMNCHIGSRPIYLCRSGHCEQVRFLTGYPALQESLLESTPPGRKRICDLQAVAAQDGPYAAKFAAKRRKVDVENDDRQTPLSPGKKLEALSMATSDAHLSPQGSSFAKRLAKLLADKHGNKREIIQPFTSTLPRAIETAALALPYETNRSQPRSALGLLNTGVCHGLTVKQLQENLPDEFAVWMQDPFRYRFPGGESILDMNKRLIDMVMEIESEHNPVLIVSHLSTCQSLLAYFLSLPLEQVPAIEVPQHGVLVLTPSNYGWSMKVIHEDELPALDM
jgi:6-phosphofructo-2-kinase